MRKFVLQVKGSEVGIDDSHIQILFDPNYFVDAKALMEDFRAFLEKRTRIPVKLSK